MLIYSLISISILSPFILLTLVFNDSTVKSIPNGRIDSTTNTPLFNKSPVIIVPGDGGNQLEAKLNKTKSVHFFCPKKTDWFTIWIQVKYIIPFAIDCWSENIKLIYNETTKKTSNAPGVEIRVPGFGNTATIEYLDPKLTLLSVYLHSLVDGLTKLGYERGKSIHGAPYDFRRSPHEMDQYYSDLTNLIEETYSMNNNSKVTLICHSFGCQVSYYFLIMKDKVWKDKYISKYIALAAPWGGSVKTLRAWVSGDNFGVPIIERKVIRRDEVSFPSSAVLMPSQAMWGPNEVLVQIGDINITTANYRDFFTAIGDLNGYKLWLNNKDITLELRAPQVETYCIHGFGIPTMKKLTYSSDVLLKNAPKIEYGAGDGTVNLRSLTACTKWEKEQKEPLIHKTFEAIDHIKISHASQVIDYIRSILSNNSNVM